MKKSPKDFVKFVSILRFEAVTLLVFALVLLQTVDGSLWLLAASFLLFDISAIGYIKNERIGALTYNLVHNYALPLIVIAAGIGYDRRTLIITGCYWLFHVALDRSLGYGLKHTHSFNETHLGKIKK